MQITLGNLHASCTQIFPCDPCTWLYPCIWPHPVTLARGFCPSQTQFIELSQLNTPSQFCQKHNFFNAPKIRSISTWRITWLLLFTLSILLDQPSLFVTRLTVLQRAAQKKYKEQERRVAKKKVQEEIEKKEQADAHAVLKILKEKEKQKKKKAAIKKKAKKDTEKAC